MSDVYRIADDYVERLARLEPLGATFMGIAGHDHEMTDFSPAGSAASHALTLETLGKTAQATPATDLDRIARDCLIDHLKLAAERHDAQEHLRALNILTSPVQHVRQVFDLMPRNTVEGWRNIAERLSRVPRGLAGYQATLEDGQGRGLSAAARQASQCILQIETWTGQKGTPSFFSGLAASFEASGLADKALQADLDRGILLANQAYIELGRFLAERYLSQATAKDAMGRDRYRLAARVFNGVELDLEETYAWGWEQLEWIERELIATSERILPGQGVEAAKRLLETDPARSIDGVDAFKHWMQDLQDRTIAELDGRHFDLPEPVKRIEAVIAPPGGALAMYYTGPSEDFSRPGRTWYPTGGKTRFPVWGEVVIAYHEGVPGHHFQIATTRYLSDTLSRFQRLIAGTSGYIEGWALYAERLMTELGYLENPDYYLGWLRSQALRTVRIVIDIGMHLELPTPKNQRFHPGEVWNPELGLEFIRERSHFPPDFVANEISRYLGMPGQAISYKVGEREWLQAREEAKRRQGPRFDLKAWHNRALRLGPMGLAQMKREMAAV